MGISGILISRLLACHRRLGNAWRLRRLAWLERLFLERLEIGSRVACQVPVRSGGAGSLIIGDRKAFGYWAAPLLGDGGILLQPRSPRAEIRIGNGNLFS